LDFKELGKRVENTYKTPVAGILPVCEEMFELGSGGIFCLRYPNHSWTQKISAIAKQITGSGVKLFAR
jgi:MinD-like ATPase involved in chromosome partitioning or flagellar assembly